MKWKNIYFLKSLNNALCNVPAWKIYASHEIKWVNIIFFIDSHLPNICIQAAPWAV